MPAAVYLDLAVSACATTFSPGPNNILLLSSTSTHGFRKCMPLIFGIWTGLLTVMLICGFGCAFLGELVPQIVPVAKYVGAAYILYLAWKTLIRKTGDAAAESKLQAPDLCQRLFAPVPERQDSDAGHRLLLRLHHAVWVPCG